MAKKTTVTCALGVLLASLQVFPNCNSFSTFSPARTPTSKTITTNVNFEDWIKNQPAEINEWNELTDVEGVIPAYVNGTWIRNGAGMWSSSDDDSFSHIFDGFAKISAYKFSKGSVYHQTRFLEGLWYPKFRSECKLPPSIGTGPILDASENPKLGWCRTTEAVWNVCTSFDNAPVNVWDFDPLSKINKQSKLITAITDAPPRIDIDHSTMETLGSTTINRFAKDAKGYELLITAHPLYSLMTDDTHNIGVELGLGGVKINLLKESPSGDRVVVGSFDMPGDDAYGGIPYFHSFGLSRNYAIIVVMPLRLNLDVTTMLEKGFLRVMNHIDRTRIDVMDLQSGEVVLDDQSVEEPIYFYHGISTSEVTTQDGASIVSFRLCAYKIPDQLTGDHQFLRLEQARKGREWRNKIHKGGKFCDVVCDLKRQTTTINWKDDLKQGFELPITRYSRSHGGAEPALVPIDAHPRYVYSFGAYAMGSEDYDSWGLFKFDTETWQVEACYREDSVYLSEPAFVPDPEGTMEDDGVLLCQAFFGALQETKLLVLDAKTMELIATASTGMRIPMDFHGGFFPNKI